MRIRTVLFDLDGTLLPMDQDVFVKHYFKGLCQKMAPYGYAPDAMVNAVWAGTAAMVKNDGSRLCETAFWEKFTAILGDEIRAHESTLDQFYRNEFQAVKEVCGHNAKAAETVRALNEKGYTVALATNPIFPAVATESRIGWAGLSPKDFALYTTYENSHFCKPNPAYYQEIVKKLGVRAEECLMVGNDVQEDMVAQTLGMQTFLLTDCLINKNDEDISSYPQGGFDELMAFIAQNAEMNRE